MGSGPFWGGRYGAGEPGAACGPSTGSGESGAPAYEGTMWMSVRGSQPSSLSCTLGRGLQTCSAVSFTVCLVAAFTGRQVLAAGCKGHCPLGQGDSWVAACLRACPGPGALFLAPCPRPSLRPPTSRLSLRPPTSRLLQEFLSCSLCFLFCPSSPFSASQLVNFLQTPIWAHPYLEPFSALLSANRRMAGLPSLAPETPMRFLLPEPLSALS